VGILVFLVPALLVVVLGYVVGYAVWEAVGAPGSPEPAGWLTGLALLAVLIWAALHWHRRR
jgi:divalent metal cation (Fe/Co/Zn/Cd) transporter